jgi:hypothetical protein
MERFCLLATGMKQPRVIRHRGPCDEMLVTLPGRLEDLAPRSTERQHLLRRYADLHTAWKHGPSSAPGCRCSLKGSCLTFSGSGSNSVLTMRTERKHPCAEEFDPGTAIHCPF